MVMKPEPLAAAVQSRKNDRTKNSRVIFLSPQGRSYNQNLARELAGEDHLILVCGRYEGVDERFISRYVDDEISIGDFILTGGELGAMVLVDSITRLVPGVLGCSDSALKDTFCRHLLKHAQYTRPRSFEGVEVPEEVISGNHEKIGEYRFLDSVARTLKKRPDLIKTETFSAAECKLLQEKGVLARVQKAQKTGETDGSR